MTDENYHYDVLVVGAGNAACSAALAALEETPRVAMLEKAPKRDRGGNSMPTVQMRFAFNGIEDLRPLIRNTYQDELRPLLESRWPQFLVRLLVLAGFVFTILAGLFGSSVGSHNFAIIFVWIAWWKRDPLPKNQKAHPY